jgi:dihydrofolate synthase/folylpolyglutamate synthase
MALAPSTARFATLAEWLAWQETLHPQAIDLSLDRCGAVADRMGLRRLGCPVISVAGTNGKGSSAMLLEAILRAGGYRVGCYTSPHLLRYNERIRVAGAPVSDATICEAFARVEAARGATSLTYFEFGTLAAFSIFTRRRVDAAVLEVGLGGRLDAVNLVDADVALITAIGIDHVEWLGHTRDLIAREKAGICRPRRPAVCSDPDAPSGLSLAAQAIGCRLERLGVDFHFERSGEFWNWWSSRAALEGLPLPALSGAHQLGNAAGVLQALSWLPDCLPIKRNAIETGLTGVRLPGRLQHHTAGAEIVFDVAHNVQAAEVLGAHLAACPIPGRTRAVLGMVKDKDAKGFMRALEPYVDEWHLASLPPPRGMHASALAELRAASGRRKLAREYPSVTAACAAADERARARDRILVTGSFVTVGEAMRAFRLQ